MESLGPALIAVAAITLTYVMCIRPMRRGQCGMMPQQHADSEREAAVARLRAEIAELRRGQQSSSAGDPTGPH